MWEELFKKYIQDNTKPQIIYWHCACGLIHWMTATDTDKPEICAFPARECTPPISK